MELRDIISNYSEYLDSFIYKLTYFRNGNKTVCFSKTTIEAEDYIKRHALKNVNIICDTPLRHFYKRINTVFGLDKINFDNFMDCLFGGTYTYITIGFVDDNILSDILYDIDYNALYTDGYLEESLDNYIKTVRRPELLDVIYSCASLCTPDKKLILRKLN
jgi:hypothetical protein